MCANLSTYKPGSPSGQSWLTFRKYAFESDRENVSKYVAPVRPFSLAGVVLDQVCFSPDGHMLAAGPVDGFTHVCARYLLLTFQRLSTDKENL